MNSYIRKIASVPDFEQKGYFKGYNLCTGELGVEVDYIEMESGHKFYQKESKSILKFIEIMNPPFEPSTHIDTRKNDL